LSHKGTKAQHEVKQEDRGADSGGYGCVDPLAIIARQVVEAGKI